MIGISPDTSGISPLYYKQSIPSGKRKGEAKTSTCTRASDGFAQVAGQEITFAPFQEAGPSNPAQRNPRLPKSRRHHQTPRGLRGANLRKHNLALSCRSPSVRATPSDNQSRTPHRTQWRRTRREDRVDDAQDLLIRWSGEWNRTMVESVLPELAEEIYLVKPSLLKAEDAFCWLKTKTESNPREDYSGQSNIFSSRMASCPSNVIP
ncbi:hypothetical protein HID58_002317 [Brassica napus]|uniref:Uncharacterized protein n=1 Tax=Brassica napus TaxID=3708 RepID=A0ABQ8ELW3_BRANA|nr:hypothetical protein HID58_002317 [Brassica napus]